MEMEIASSRAPNCTCSHTPPEDASEATSTEPCSPAPGRAFPANQPLAQVVTANLLLLKEARPSSSFRYTRFTVYIIGCWTYNLLSDFLVILKTKTTTQISILPLLPLAFPFFSLFGIRNLSEWVDDSALIWFIALAAWRYFRLFVNLYSFWRYNQQVFLRSEL